MRYVVRNGPVLNYCFGRRRRSSAADQLALQVRKLCGVERPGVVHGYPVPQQSSVLWGGGFGGGGDSSKSLPLELLEPLMSSLSHVRPLGIQMQFRGHSGGIRYQIWEFKFSVDARTHVFLSSGKQEVPASNPLIILISNFTWAESTQART